jgi:TP901 family phage tail tape measure protein
MASAYSIEAVFNLIDKVTKPMDNINKQGDIVNAGLKKVFSNAQKYADKFAGRLKRLGSGLLKLAGISAFLNFNSIKSFLMADITNALELADTMAKIGTVVDATAPPLNELQKNLTDVSNAAGFTVKELAAIAYTAIPSGIAAEASADFAAVVAKTAKVTGTASEKIIDGLTTVVNAYGMGAEEAARISGMMFTTNRLGKTSFEDMATGMRHVIPAAAQLGIATEDVFASITALTGGGLTTKVAMKTLGDSLSAVTHPTKAAAEMAQRLGIDFSEAALRSKGFAGFMEDLRKKTGGNTKILEALFGNEDVALSISKLTSTNAQAFSNALAEMGNAMNTIDEQFAKVTDTPAERWKKAMNKISNAGTALGTALLPVVERVIGRVTEIADRIAALDFSQIASVVDVVFSKIEGFANLLWGTIQIAWQFRGAILVVVGAMTLYHMAQLLAVGWAKLLTFWENAKRIASIATAIAFGTQATALGLLKSGTMGYLVVSKAFEIATKIKTALLGILTGGTLAQSAATATSAVSTPTAVDTTPQALLSIDRTVQVISTLIQSVDTTTTAILNKPVPTITADLSALRIPVQAARTPYEPPSIPLRYIETGQREREEADREDPRRIPPVSREERMAYSLQERRETVGIEVSTAQGSQARIVRRPRSPNIRLTTSGGNT